ncbi:MAG: Rho termination factor N-terminal domain-containing protein, partial [Candidatus Planktophila sp.]
MTTTELAAMTLPKLKEVASQLGIEGAAKLKKDALVTAIGDLQAANREAAKAEREARREARNAKRNNKNSDDSEGTEKESQNSNNSSDDDNDNDNSSDHRGDRGDRNDRNRNRRDRNRGRDRNGRDRGGREEREPVIGEDDVLVPVGGLVDILENYSFIRTAGYLPGPNDVYVSQGQVRKYGLRKGDVVTGQVRQAREGEQRQKYNPLITLETVNGVPVEEANARVEFGKLTPLYPQERLRLETEPNILTTRVIDLIAPIGKGQRG